MTPETFAAVDDALARWLVPEDAVLRGVLAGADADGVPSIHVSPLQGRWLHVLAKAIGARRILEIGTLAGYSAICMARALPRDGTLVTLEIDPRHAAIARRNVEIAGLADRVEIVLGAALDSLERLRRERVFPFDLVFIDADKARCTEYLDQAVELARVGATIVVDNVVREGRVSDARSTDPSVQGVRRLMERLHAHPRLAASALQTVGTKGYDGFVMAVVER
ncbi:MAG: O-methyltransferase [Phycisphaerae bacterium]|nr:O-methyltransferase [Phycisphaerae bacterium]